MPTDSDPAYPAGSHQTTQGRPPGETAPEAKPEAKPEAARKAPASAGVSGDRRATGAAPRTLSERHRRMLEVESGISAAVVAARGYFSVTKKVELKELGFPPSQQIVPGLVIPIYGVDGELKTYQYRPNDPRVDKRGKPVKYETRTGTRMLLDVHPGALHLIGDPKVPALVGEGIKKGDKLWTEGLLGLNMLGVSAYRGTNELGGKTLLSDWQYVALNDRRLVYICFDSDAMQKIEVYRELCKLRDVLKAKGADVWVIYLPHSENGKKVGVDDWFAADPSRTVDDLFALAQKEVKAPPQEVSEYRRVKEALPDAPASPDLLIPHEYVLSSGGVEHQDLRTGRDGEPYFVTTDVASEPVVVAGRQEYEGDDGGEALVLYHKRYGRWQRRIVDRGVAMDARKLTSLAAQGFPVNSITAGDLVRYIAKCETENMSHLPVETVSQRLGWQETADGEVGFLWGTTYLTGHDGAEADPEAHPHEWAESRVSFKSPDPGGLQLARGLHASGTYEGWRDAVRVVPGFPHVALGFYGSFVPPLMRIMKIQNFILDFAYGTSTGKTTLMRVAASVWGCADESQPATVLHTWDSTRTWRERAAATLNHLPFLLDDTKKARSREDVSQTIYDIASGRGRGRGTVTGTQETSSWQTVLLSTGEAPATSFGEHGGAHARTLSTHSLVWGAEDERTGRMVNKLKAGLVLNYGHAGPRFVQFLIRNRNRWDEFRKLYEASHERYINRAGDRAVAVRMAEYFAAIDTAAQLAHEALDLPWPYSDPIDYLYDTLTAEASVADRAESAMRVALEHAASNQQAFWLRNKDDHEGHPRQPSGGWIGHWPEGDDFAHIGFIPSKLHEILQRHGHDDPQTLIRLWRDKGWLRMTQENGGKQRHTRIRIEGANTYVVAVDGGIARRILGGHDA
ncbi:MAG: DUF927 domain-containing protein [Actinomycetota bacterium]|nr:DUF927 domain-containing protein [Actinomycetota bacterium]